jgi:hypothetical protein
MHGTVWAEETDSRKVAIFLFVDPQTDEFRLEKLDLSTPLSENSLTQSLAPIASGTNKRRTTRVVQALPIKVKGEDALHEPFTEQTSTVMVSCHGCKYQSKYYVPKGSVVTVEIPRLAGGSSPRTVTAKVIWVQRPRNPRETLHIGLEFDVAGNVWDIAVPPKDWFLLPGEKAFVAEEAAPAPTFPPGSSTELMEMTTSWDESEIPVVASSGPETESEFTVARQTVDAGALTASANGEDHVEPKIGAQMLQAIEEAVNSSIARLSQSIADQARTTYEANNSELHAKIKSTVEEALTALAPGKLTRAKKKK